MVNEIWVDIPRLKGYYQISNFGNVRSLDRVVERKHLHPNKVKGRVLSPFTNRDGYLYYCTYIGRKKIMVFPQREVAIHFIENPLNKPEVNHIDGNKKNNHYSNLEWCTRKENVNHSDKMGLRNLNGENSPLSKLKNSDVFEIRKLFSSGNVTKAFLSKKFGVASNTITGIVERRYWKHI